MPTVAKVVAIVSTVRVTFASPFALVRIALELAPLPKVPVYTLEEQVGAQA